MARSSWNRLARTWATKPRTCAWATVRFAFALIQRGTLDRDLDLIRFLVKLDEQVALFHPIIIIDQDAADLADDPRSDERHVAVDISIIGRDRLERPDYDRSEVIPTAEQHENRGDAQSNPATAPSVPSAEPVGPSSKPEARNRPRPRVPAESEPPRTRIRRGSPAVLMMVSTHGPAPARRCRRSSCSARRFASGYSVFFICRRTPISKRFSV